MRWIFLLFVTFSNITWASIELIAPGKVSTNFGEHSPTFDVHSNELIFMRRTPGQFDYTLYSSTLSSDEWSEPIIVEFSGKFRDAAPYFSPNGQNLVFDSKRPSTELTKDSINIWQVNRRADGGWSEPFTLGYASSNGKDETKAGRDEFGPLLTDENKLLFYSFRQPKRGGAYYQADADSTPQMKNEIPDPSASTFIAYLTLSKDGNTAVMEGRGQGSSATDLYYACKSNGKWSEATPLTAVNTKFGEGTPFITADSRWLWFASSKPTSTGNTDGLNIYRVSTQNLPIPCA
jgi:Tol biopolymer transport system component